MITTLLFVIIGIQLYQLFTMPSQSDLDQAVASVDTAVSSAADRVIAAQGNAVSQASLDALAAVKTKADEISPV